jgi:hypothetical protein
MLCDEIPPNDIIKRYVQDQLLRSTVCDMVDVDSDAFHDLAALGEAADFQTTFILQGFYFNDLTIMKDIHKSFLNKLDNDGFSECDASKITSWLEDYRAIEDNDYLDPDLYDDYIKKLLNHPNMTGTNFEIIVRAFLLASKKYNYEDLFLSDKERFCTLADNNPDLANEYLMNYDGNLEEFLHEHDDSPSLKQKLKK